MSDHDNEALVAGVIAAIESKSLRADPNMFHGHGDLGAEGDDDRPEEPPVGASLVDEVSPPGGSGQDGDVEPGQGRRRTSTPAEGPTCHWARD